MLNAGQKVLINRYVENSQDSHWETRQERRRGLPDSLSRGLSTIHRHRGLYHSMILVTIR